MAATGKTPILLYGSTTATNAPVAGNLTNSSDGCEIAINVADKNLFFKDATNTVNTVPIRQSSGSSDGWLSSANWTTFNSKQAALVSGTNIKTVSGTTLLGSGDLGTIGTGYGGTGLTSFTANGVVYASSTSALATSSNYTWNGNNLGIKATVSSWGTYYPGIEGLGPAAFAIGAQANSLQLSAGIYNNNSFQDLYAVTGQKAAKYLIDAPTGTHAWFVNNTNGTTGNVATLTQAMDISATGNITANIGNLVIGTSGKGIDFSATPGTGTSELLADYEEGTFTATLTPETSGTITINSSVNTMVYRKIGKVVVVTGLLQVSAVSLPVGIYVTLNLPYAASSSVYGGQAGGSASRIPNGSSTPTATPWIIPRNTANLNLYYIVATTASSDQINFSITYVTD